jgi:transposase, IS30 family
MSHLNLEQRYTIAEMHSLGKSYEAIAIALSRSKSVISREITRNRDGRSLRYSADLAQRKAEGRKRSKNTRKDFTEEIKAHVEGCLKQKYSPEQIVGFSKKQDLACVSHESIYKYIWDDKRKGGKLHKNLRNKGKKYRKRGSKKDNRGLIPERVSIEERPAIVDERARFGDWEIDTIIGKNKKGAIVTVNDRATGILRMQKLNGKDATELANEVIVLLMEFRALNNTMTSDNGKEFARFALIAEQLNLTYYFAHPYSSWERGSNENLNGLIRQYIPKGTNFETMTDEYIQWIEDELNNRPRKRFNFESPNHIFQTTVALAN